MNYDILLRDGFIVDGTGGPWYKSDIGVKGSKIAEIGKKLPVTGAKRVIEAKGYVVSPGFFDMHTHSEIGYLKYPLVENKLMQGVTTELTGNCGISFSGPMKGGVLESFKEMVRMQEIPVEIDWRTLAEYMDKLGKFGGVSVNSAYMVGFGTVRMSLLGWERGPPTKDQLDEMKEMVAGAMKEGAFGLSTGTQYPPQNYAKTDEIIELAKVVARYGGIHQSHVRRRGWTGDERPGRAFLKPTFDTMFEAVRECIEIGEQADIPTIWSHAKIAGAWTMKSVCAPLFLKLVDEARRRGVDVTIDTWGDRYIGISASKVVPIWAFEGGFEKLRTRLQDPELRRKICSFAEEAMGDGCEGDIEQTIITNVKLEKNKEFEGKTISEIAKRKGKTIVDFYLDNISEGGQLSLYSPCQTEEDNIKLIKHQSTLFGTDASPGNHSEETGVGYGLYKGSGYGLYPRILRKYVREEGVLTLEEAVRKMTSACANRLGLMNRGLLKPRMWADIVVFDPINVSDRPLQPPKGICYVLVNGVITVDNGKHTGARAGKILKHKPSLQQ